MSSAEVVELVMAHQWETYLMIAGWLGLCMWILWRLFRLWKPVKRRFRERF